MPNGFRFDTGVKAAGPFVNALNVSLVTLTTLGFGDITTTSYALRLILPLARTTATRFHGSGATTPEELLRAYARDHLVHER
jgi:hypothetical protein